MKKLLLCFNWQTGALDKFFFRSFKSFRLDPKKEHSISYLRNLFHLSLIYIIFPIHFRYYIHLFIKILKNDVFDNSGFKTGSYHFLLMLSISIFT